MFSAKAYAESIGISYRTVVARHGKYRRHLVSSFTGRLSISHESGKLLATKEHRITRAKYWLHVNKRHRKMIQQNYDVSRNALHTLNFGLRVTEFIEDYRKKNQL